MSEVKKLADVYLDVDTQTLVYAGDDEGLSILNEALIKQKHDIKAGLYDSILGE
jgi:hypothetical protein